MTEKNESSVDDDAPAEIKETEAEIHAVQPPTPPVAVEPPPQAPSTQHSGADVHAAEDIGDGAVSEVTNLELPADSESNQTPPQVDTAIDVSEDHLDAVVFKYQSRRRELEIFADGVRSLLMDHPDLYRDGECIVHSSKFRLKDPDHLKRKVVRKAALGKLVDEDNLFETVTDLSGVRILHLFQEDFRYVDALVRRRVDEGDWYLFERPVANTWDPEAKGFFSQFDLDVRQTETLYTSVHYLIKPRQDSPLCCEVQVRTLFEEIWGEVDHQINYPTQTSSISLREQLLVLSKITGAGSRLLDSIRRVTDAND